MPNLGAPELVLILLIVIIVFGAGRLPEIGSALGKGIRDFKKGLQDEPEAPKPPAQNADQPKS
jgi:sec-independent protein translocase protein TatA